MSNFIKAQIVNLKSAGTASTPQTERSATSSGRLSFYQTPPSSIISIEDFEQYAVDRLRGGPAAHLHCLHLACNV